MRKPLRAIYDFELFYSKSVEMRRKAERLADYLDSPHMLADSEAAALFLSAGDLRLLVQLLEKSSWDHLASYPARKVSLGFAEDDRSTLLGDDPAKKAGAPVEGSNPILIEWIDGVKFVWS